MARLEGSDGGETVMLWDAHQDTVPVEGMTIEPFSPVVRNGRLWGRGMRCEGEAWLRCSQDSIGCVL